MDLNEYALATLVAIRIEDARAAAARRRLVPRRPGVRAWLGAVLVAIGQRLLAGERARTAAAAWVAPRHA